MGKVSTQIRKRLKDAGIRFHANDNISKHIYESEKEQLEQEVREAFQNVLDALVIDTENDHNTRDTAKRVAKMYVREIFGGRFNPHPAVTSLSLIHI